MARGDHLFVWRRYGAVPFQHHAIDLGDGNVIHLSSEDGDIVGPLGDASQFTVFRYPLAQLTRGGRDRLHVVQHAQPFGDVENIIARAESQLGRRGYQLFHDNCEHFASWCMTGRSASQQVLTATERATAATVKGSLVAATLAVKSLRVVKPWLVASDAVQFATEALGHHVGLDDPIKRKVASRVLGGVTAVGVGMLGGPVGIAICSGTWIAGEVGGALAARCVMRHRQEIDGNLSVAMSTNLVN